MFVVTRRAAILIPSGPAEDIYRQHLFVCLNDPFGPPKQVLLASICSIPKSGTCDSACLVNVGDHEFVKHPSFISYSQARMSDEASLLAGVSKAVFHPKELASEALVARIVDGLFKSARTKPFVKDFMDRVLGRRP